MQTKHKRQGNKKNQDFHQAGPLALRWARKAFKITRMDEPDIAAAAISSVARLIASGTAKRL